MSEPHNWGGQRLYMTQVITPFRERFESIKASLQAALGDVEKLRQIWHQDLIPAANEGPTAYWRNEVQKLIDQVVIQIKLAEKEAEMAKMADILDRIKHLRLELRATTDIGTTSRIARNAQKMAKMYSQNPTLCSAADRLHQEALQKEGELQELRQLAEVGN